MTHFFVALAGILSMIAAPIMVCSLSYALAEFLRPDEFSGFFGVILGTLGGFIFGIISFPAWVSGGILAYLFGGEAPSMNGGDPWALVRLNAPLFWLTFLAWIAPVFAGSVASVTIPIIGTLFPSSEAKHNFRASDSHSGVGKYFSIKKSSREAAEDAERTSLAAELDETIRDIERTQYEIKKRSEHDQ